MKKFTDFEEITEVSNVTMLRRTLASKHPHNDMEKDLEYLRRSIAASQLPIRLDLSSEQIFKRKHEPLASHANANIVVHSKKSVLNHRLKFYEKIMRLFRNGADDLRIALFYFAAVSALFGGLYQAFAKLYSAYKFFANH